MVSLAARSASRTAWSTDSRSTPGIDGTGARALFAVHDEQRPDQVVGGELVLAHHAARPFAAPVAAQADGKVEAFAGGLLDGGQMAAGFDGAAEFDCHGDVLRASF